MTGTDYPFVDSGDYIGLVADFYLGHRVREFALPLRIKWLYGVTIPVQTLGSHTSSSSAGLPAPTHAADLLVVDANDQVIFDSTGAEYRHRDWGAFRIHEWQADDAVCRLMQHTESDLVYPDESTPDLVLDERTAESWPTQVLSLTVNDLKLDGAVRISRGYNTRVLLTDTVISPGKRRSNRVFLSAVPGEGEGVFPGCADEEIVIRRINQVGPDSRGNFTLASKGCYWINRGGAVEKVGPGDYALTVDPALEHGLRIHNDCSPCCSCDDFVNTYRGIRKLYDRYKTFGERSRVVGAVYAENRERWLAGKECREANSARVEMIATAGGTMTIAVSLGNTTGTCLEQGRVDIDIASADPSPVLVPNSIMWLPAGRGSYETDRLYGGYPSYWSVWEPMDIGRSGKIRFVLVFDGSPGDMVTVVVTPLFNGIPGDPVSLTRSLIF